MASVIDVIGLSSTLVQGDLHCLYESAKEGLSFNRLAYQIIGYDGPSILLINHRGGLLGVYIGTNVQDISRYHGSVETYLFTF
jgi:hypothetical protein